MKYNGLTITGVKDEDLGVFSFDEKFDTIDWRHPTGEEISLTTQDWIRLNIMLEDILTALGVWTE